MRAQTECWKRISGFASRLPRGRVSAMSGTTACVESKVDVGELTPSSAELVDLSIIVPTYNERENVVRLIQLLDEALKEIRWEVIFVDDDSPDGTSDKVRSLARTDRRVRCIQRVGRRGLSSACIEGVLSSSAPFFAVMDGDLQHDERILPTMLEKLKNEDAQLAVGTRYAEGGSMGNWSKTRTAMSKFATTICQLATGVTLSDPMSGFFMMRRETFQSIVKKLSGLGFKILVDIAASRSDGKINIVEVPYEFRTREAGESKLDTLAMWQFFLLLLDKRIGHIIPVRFISFSIVGGIGVFVHFAVMIALFEFLSTSFAAAQFVAASIAMISNFFLNNLLTYRDIRLTGWRWIWGLASFVAVCSIGLAANVGIANYIYSSNTNWVVSALSGILIGAVWNYALSSVYTWRR